jgi:hypothetical protein
LAGGTSFAAPIFAGFVALLNEAEHATGQGNINPVLYSLATNPNSYAATFHDITSGSNACVAAAANCATADESSYAATAGYDEATGLGSVNFNALTAAWPSNNSENLQATTVLLIASETSASSGQTIPIQINVQSLFSSNGTSIPTGSVSVSVDGTVVDSSLAFTATDSYYSMASTTYNFVAPTTAGSHLIAVSYSGDATHSPATATYSMLIGNVLATGGLSVTAGNLTIANGGTGSTQVTVTPTGGYNGRIVWSLTATGTSSLSACYAIGSLPVSSTSTTKLTIGVGAACNSALPADHVDFRTVDQRALANGKTQAHWSSKSTTGAYACLLIFGCLAGGRRKWRLSLVLVILLLPIAGANLIGCGGGGANNTGTSTTTPSTPSNTTTYSITLTGTDSVNSSISASTTFTLMVN